MKTTILIILSIILGSYNIIIANDEVISQKKHSIQCGIKLLDCNDTTRILIQNVQDIGNLVAKDTNAKNKLDFLYFYMDKTYEVTDFINEFHNLNGIYLNWHCAGINIKKSPKKLKSIIIANTVDTIYNLNRLEFIERIEFEEYIFNEYFYKILKDFKHLKDLSLDLPSDYNTINKNVIALDNLEKLEIRRTGMKIIPKEICKMKGLKELTIESDQFLKVPDCIFKMDSLRVLTMIGTDKDVAKFYEKYKDKNPRIEIKTIGGKNYY